MSSNRTLSAVTSLVNPNSGRFRHMQKRNVFGFTGQRYEPEVRMYAFPYRTYNPKTMRWLTEDPARDGSNWYAYASDPVNSYDPLGLWIEENDSLVRQEKGEGYTKTEIVKEIEIGHPGAGKSELKYNIAAEQESIADREEGYGYLKESETLNMKKESIAKTGITQVPVIGDAVELVSLTLDLTKDTDYIRPETGDEIYRKEQTKITTYEGDEGWFEREYENKVFEHYRYTNEGERYSTL